MEEKELKTSLKQRVVIIIIAVLMLGSMIASYAAIVLAGGKSSSANNGQGLSEEVLARYEEAYDQAVEEFSEITKNEFEQFIQFKEKIRAYDEEAANNGGVVIKDRIAGSGRTITEGDTDYLTFYVGWCASGNIFDSSFDDDEEPTGFKSALVASEDMIEGWKEGVVGMKIGGIREITVPGDKAYGDSMDICGGMHKPLKFMVMAVANEEPLKSAASKVDQAYLRLEYGYYGINYDDMQ